MPKIGRQALFKKYIAPPITSGVRPKSCGMLKRACGQLESRRQKCLSAQFR